MDEDILKQPFFKRHELECPCCKVMKIDADAFARLMKLRFIVGFAMPLTSAYRCDAHNKKVGGIESSLHKEGMAFDIDTSKMTAYEKYALINHAMHMGFSGVGVGKNYMHIDTNQTRFAFWAY